MRCQHPESGHVTLPGPRIASPFIQVKSVFSKSRGEARNRSEVTKGLRRGLDPSQGKLWVLKIQSKSAAPAAASLTIPDLLWGLVWPPPPITPPRSFFLPLQKTHDCLKRRSEHSRKNNANKIVSVNKSLVKLKHLQFLVMSIEDSATPATWNSVGYKLLPEENQSPR